MKTLSFHNLKIGRSTQSVLLELDTTQDAIRWNQGLFLIAAPNGYGKTTLLQTIGGVVTPKEGRLEIDGKKLNPETDVLYVSEYLTFPKFIYPMEWIEFMSGRSGDPSLREELKPWIEGFRLEGLMGKFLGRMSQGERRKMTWLGAFASRKPVLLLDEPLDGLDLLAIDTAKKMLAAWKSQGRIIGIVAHQVSEVLDQSDEVYLVRDRKLVPWSKHAGTPASKTSSDEFRKKVLEFYK